MRRFLNLLKNIVEQQTACQDNVLHLQLIFSF
jgi:hypothetical protein